MCEEVKLSKEEREEVKLIYNMPIVQVVYGYHQMLKRINKAIEYIMTELISEWDIENNGYVSGSDLPADAITPLLEILRGNNDKI